MLRLVMAALVLATGAAPHAHAAEAGPARRTGVDGQATGKPGRQASSPAVQKIDYRRWLDRDVAYLITDEERRTFRALTDAGERARFVAEFWARRDPTPGTAENEFRDEHYRRLDEADRRYGSGVPGWKTDRGRIYISWGPPDFVETNPIGARGFALGALSEAPELPSEMWTYEHLPPRLFGSSQVQIVFVDRGGGDYRLLTDPNDVNLAYVYRLNTAANPLQYESAAFFDPATGLKGTDGAAEMAKAQALGPDKSGSLAANAFERISLTSDLGRTPAELLEDVRRSQSVRGLEQDIRSQFFARRLPLGIDVPVFATSSPQSYCPIAVSIAGDAIVFERGDRYRASLVTRGEVKDLKSGATVRQFSEAIEFRLTPETHSRGVINGFSYQKGLMLPPGEYRVDVIVKQPAASALGVASATVHVPPARGLRIAGLVLAENASAAVPGQTGPFTLGTLAVVPRPGREFGCGQTLYAVYQVTGFAARDAQPRVTVDYTILLGETVVLRTDIQPVDPASLTDAASGGAGVLLVRPFPLAALTPGDYVLQVKAIDHVAGTHAIARSGFRVRQ